MATKLVLTALKHVWATLEPIGCPCAFEDILTLKMNAGRLIDRADAAALLRLNRATLDLPYLLGWVSRLNLHSEWAGIWAEAFPGEPRP
jgi:hypothetical protein